MLNRSFVPVYLSLQSGGRGSSTSTEEQQRLEAIQKRFRSKGLRTGQVWVYILSPQGEAIESMHVAEAIDVERLMHVLKRNARAAEIAAADPVLKPRAGATPPSKPAGGILLHLASRGQNRGTWREFPVESWIALSSEEIGQITGGGPPNPGAHWVMAPSVSGKILTHFYPATEDPSIEDRNKIEVKRLDLRVLSVEAGKVLARVDGDLKMRRAFYPGRPADVDVKASITGYIEYDATTRYVSRFRLAAHSAEFGDEPFDVALREHNR